MKRAATIMLATIAYWVVAIAIIVALGNMFPPDSCGTGTLLMSKCVVEVKLRLGAGLIGSFVLYILAFWMLMRHRRRAGL